MKLSDYELVFKYIKTNEHMPLNALLKRVKEMFMPNWTIDALLSICLFHYQLCTKLKYPVSRLCCFAINFKRNNSWVLTSVLHRVKNYILVLKDFNTVKKCHEIYHLLKNKLETLVTRLC